mmetsp:Transcript_416/g.937  ORF Transcript_416/g.937 Transcript_416/m.937 type:complete len:350 (-) Transcript_416:221-1270(-)
MAALTAARSAAQAVNVLRAVGGHAHLDDLRDAGVVQPAGRHVAGEHDHARARAELVALLRAVGLRLAAVHLDHLDAVQVEELRVELREARRGEEDDDLVVGVGALLLDDRRQRGELVGAGHHQGLLRHVLVRRLLLTNAVHKLVVRGQRDLDDGAQVLRHCGAEDQCLELLLAGQLLHDLQDGWLEAHVQQLVALVKHKHREAGEQRRERVVLQVVVQAAGRGDQDVGRALRELLDVAVDVCAAVHDLDAEAGVEAQQPGALVRDLLRQLARGAQHQRAHGAAALRGRDGRQALQRGDQKRERLARARLGLHQHVCARQAVRDRLHLHQGHRLVPKLLVDGLQRGGRDR